MTSKRLVFLVTLLTIVVLLSACQPQEVVKEVIVTQEVEREVVVTQEVEVEKEVVVTVEVEVEAEVPETKRDTYSCQWGCCPRR